MCKREPLFSIIIPVYNTEEYLNRCINSVINQTFNDFEIIIVDDFSNGNCEEIVKNYTDKRIKYIRHNSNMGTLQARKTGTINAKGKYITYLDSDDEFDTKALYKVYQNIDNNDYDVIHFSVKAISYNTNKKEKIKEEKKNSFYLSSRRNNINSNYLFNELLNEKIAHNIYAKFFKLQTVKEAIEYIPNIHITFAEDMLQSLIFFYFAKSYKSISDDLYIYYCDISYSNKNTNNLTIDRFNKMCLDSKRALDEFYNFLVKMNANTLYMYEYLKLVYNQYRFLLNKINYTEDNEYKLILDKYYTNDILSQYNQYQYLHNYYLLSEKKLEVINSKLLPYFFSIIIDGFYTNIRIFGIRINLRNKRNYSNPIVITLSNILRYIFSVYSQNNNTILKFLGFNFIIWREY